MSLHNSLGYLLKIAVFLAVLGVVLLSLTVFIYSFYSIFKVIDLVLFHKPEDGEVILKALKAIDSVLLGVVFFMIGLGLYELFIHKINNLPDWLQIRNIDELKAMLIKVVVLVIGISFTGRIVTWDGNSDLLGYGIGLGAVIAALSFFLRVKIKEEKETK